MLGSGGAAAAMTPPTHLGKLTQHKVLGGYRSLCKTAERSAGRQSGPKSQCTYITYDAYETAATGSVFPISCLYSCSRLLLCHQKILQNQEKRVTTGAQHSLGVNHKHKQVVLSSMFVCDQIYDEDYGEYYLYVSIRAYEIA